ncbi:MAG: hypothetical protein E7359_00115 [Clostridiales bacterium]|nr:hypothetical protein [Clostridiales bacterium]
MELKLADLEKENPKYIRKDIDGGYLSEKYEIDRYKYEQYIDVVDNLMLGNYNEFGEYVIQDDIKEELIKCTKVIEDNYENILFVKSEAKVNAFSYLNFAVKVIDNEKAGYKTAILELLEPIYKAKGFIENTQATKLKKVVLANNDIFRQEVYKAFNILVNTTTEGSKIELEEKDTDEDFKAIIERKIKLLYIKQNIEQEESNYYEIAYNKNVEELNKTEEGKKVLENTKKDEAIAKKYLNVESNDYKSKNDLLMKNVETIYPKVPEPIQTNNIGVQKTIVKHITDSLFKLAAKAKQKLDTKNKPYKSENITTTKKPTQPNISKVSKGTMNNIIEDIFTM